MKMSTPQRSRKSLLKVRDLDDCITFDSLIEGKVIEETTGKRKKTPSKDKSHLKTKKYALVEEKENEHKSSTVMESIVDNLKLVVNALHGSSEDDDSDNDLETDLFDTLKKLGVKTDSKSLFSPLTPSKYKQSLKNSKKLKKCENTPLKDKRKKEKKLKQSKSVEKFQKSPTATKYTNSLKKIKISDLGKLDYDEIDDKSIQREQKSVKTSSQNCVKTSFDISANTVINKTPELKSKESLTSVLEKTPKKVDCVNNKLINTPVSINSSKKNKNLNTVTPKQVSVLTPLKYTNTTPLSKKINEQVGTPKSTRTSLRKRKSLAYLSDLSEDDEPAPVSSNASNKWKSDKVDVNACRTPSSTRKEKAFFNDTSQVKSGKTNLYSEEDKSFSPPLRSLRISRGKNPKYHLSEDEDSPLQKKIVTPKKKILNEPKKEDSGIGLLPRTPRSSRRKTINYLELNSTSPPRKSSRRSLRQKFSPDRTIVKTPVSKKLKEAECPTTPLEKARRSLHVSAVPSALICREKEYSNIYNFLENKLLDEVGGCMYISGVPGTGKTATVTQVVRELKAASKSNDIPDFKYIELNGMRLTDPRQAYVQLWQQISGKKDKIGTDKAQIVLETWFSKSDKKKLTTVLLIDELDLMCTRKQDVVYNLLDWPSRSYSRLIVVAIANTMDMPERMLKGRVTSRLGLTRLTFHPYTHKQLESIISARLAGLQAFSSDAIQLVTRKVAAVSGDARRALDICRRATELPQPDQTVTVQHIEMAIKEMTNSNVIKIIRCCSEVEKLFLRSIVDESKRTGVEEVDLVKVVDHLAGLSTLEGFRQPTTAGWQSVLQRLLCCRIVFSNNIRAGLMQRLTLNLSQDDVYYALK